MASGRSVPEIIQHTESHTKEHHSSTAAENISHQHSIIAVSSIKTFIYNFHALSLSFQTHLWWKSPFFQCYVELQVSTKGRMTLAYWNALCLATITWGLLTVLRFSFTDWFTFTQEKTRQCSLFEQLLVNYGLCWHLKSNFL